MQSYKETFVVKWHEIDAAQELRYYAFMNMAQESANVHSAALHFGYKELIEQNQIWALSRVCIKYINPPKWGDKISIETWHKGKLGLFWLRDFALYGPSGNIDAVATTSWVIMNINTRRIERRTIFDTRDEVVESSLKRDAIKEPCDKINKPEGELSFIREHKVMYSDIDFNLHANNAKYIEWVMDSLNLEIIKNYSIKELRLNYISEARFGDIITISQINTNNNEIYMQGEREGEIVFQANLLLQQNM